MMHCLRNTDLMTYYPLDPNVRIIELDVPVNAVATALKDFFSKRLPPLFEEDVMIELEDIAGNTLQKLVRYFTLS